MLQIRTYQPEDCDAVWELHVIALQAVGAYLGDGPWNHDLSQIEAVYLQNGGEFFVGIDEGRLVAMGALKRISDERAEIKRMRVHPSCQRRGFGQTMLTALEVRARELGYRVLELDTTTVQIAAQRLYEKNGYVEVRRGRVAQFECIYYEKTLSAPPPKT